MRRSYTGRVQHGKDYPYGCVGHMDEKLAKKYLKRVLKRQVKVKRNKLIAEALQEVNRDGEC